MRPFKTVVVGVDFSVATESLLSMAAEMAERYDAQRIHLVHVVSMPTSVLPSFSIGPDTTDSVKAKVQTQLEQLKLDTPGSKVTREVRAGAPAQELADAAEGLHADLVMVSGRGHGVLAEMFLGSVASTLIRLARCPVLVVAGDQPTARFDEILAAVDLSPISRPVLEHAFRVGSRNDGRVLVLSLFEHPLLKADRESLLPRTFKQSDIDALGVEHREAIDHLIGRVPSHGVKIQVEVMSKAPAANAIVDIAKFTESDLIVLGTSGQGGLHRMILGSTANFVLNRAPCPVLVVPHEVQQEAPQNAGAAIPV